MAAPSPRPWLSAGELCVEHKYHRVLFTCEGRMELGVELLHVEQIQFGPVIQIPPALLHRWLSRHVQQGGGQLESPAGEMNV